MSEFSDIPDVGPEVEAAIGRFIIAWGALEGQIDGAIHDLLLTSLDTSTLVTANMAIRGKLDLAHALFEKLRIDDDPVWFPISRAWETRFDALINRTARSNAASRIPIVHSQPQTLDLGTSTRPLFVRWVARKGGLKGSVAVYTVEMLDKQTAEVAGLVKEWREARTHWKPAVSAMRLADADERLNRKPGEGDHLSLQLQSSPDSPPATPKPPKQPKPSRRQKREARESER